MTLLHLSQSRSLPHLDHHKKKKLVEDNSNKMKYRSNQFLGCFCFPGKSSEKKLLPEILKSGSHRKKSRWLQRFRWSGFVAKKFGGKTVPVDVNLPGKHKPAGEIHSLNPSNDQKLAQKFQSPAAGGKQGEIQVVQSDRKSPEKASEKYKNPTIITVDENAASKKIAIHKNGAFSCRKKGPKAKTVDDPNSPRAKKKSAMSRSKSQPAIFQSLTQPPAKPKNQVAAVAEQETAVKDGKNKREKSAAVARKYDPVMGMSIIMVVLVVMLLWGKLCAILFTCACFFFVSRSGAIMESDFTRKEGDFEAVYDKKKVVMEGFLARNQRKVVGFL